MSEQNEKVLVQDVMNVRYFAERMLRAMYADNRQDQEETLYELARLAAVRTRLSALHVFGMLVSIWNGETAMLRGEQMTAEAARMTVFRIIGEMFGKYGLPAGEYEEDEL